MEQAYRRADLDALDLVRFPVWVFDVERRRMWWGNHAACRFWSCADRTALRAHDFASDLSDVSAIRLHDYLRRFARGEVVEERWTLFPAGVPRTVDCTCSGLPIEGGRTAVLVQALPIPEEALDADALRAVEAQRYLPSVMTVFDGDGNALIQNPAAVETFGSLGGPLDRFHDRFADPAAATGAWQALLEQGRFRGEQRMRTRRGERWLSLDGRRTQDPASGGTAVLLSGEDVTARVQAEQELRASERRFRRLFESMEQGVLYLDLDARILDANPAAERILGVSRPQLVGTPFNRGPWRIVDAEGRPIPPERHPCRIAAHSGEPVCSATVGSHNPSSGKLHWLRLDAVPESVDGERLGYVYVVLTDITDLLDYQRTNSELERFAYAVSHDLKGPLRSISFGVNWCREELGQYLDEEGSNMVATMEQRVRYMDRLIHALLLQARGSRAGDAISSVDSAEVVRAALAGIDVPRGFSVTIAEDMPQLTANHILLEQVFVNLIGNAIKHHDRKRGHIRIRGEAGDEECRFEVADDGPGIPEADRDRVTQMFVSSSGEHGSGIGLALVRRLVEAQGGCLTLEPVGERGTVFRFTLPRFARDRATY